jgi:hypothetical protein
MFVPFGKKLFGIVDRVPGHFYVATPFLHICEFPVIPVRSHLVLEGSKVDPTFFRKGSFTGYSIYWSLKSISMAWFRGLLGLLSLAAAVTAVVMLVFYFKDTDDSQYLHIGLGAIGSIILFLGAYLLSFRLTLANRPRLVAMARRLEGKFPKAALVIQTYLKDSELGSLPSVNGQGHT